MASTVGELVKANAVALEDVQRAVDAFLEEPGVGDFVLGAGYVLDLTATIAGSLYARTVLENKNRGSVQRRDAIRTAFLLAVPRAKP